MVCADNSIKESYIFIRVCDVLIIIHADDSDTIFEIIHQSLILVDKDNASFGMFYGFIGHIDHFLGLAGSFMPYK